MGYTLKLISEHIEHDTDYLIEEDEKGKKNYKIKGIFMQDIKNLTRISYGRSKKK